MTGLRELDVRVDLHCHEAEWEDTTEEREKKLLSGLAKCRGLMAFYIVVEHWNQNGFDYGEGAKSWREELARKVTRPRGHIEEIEDKTFAVDLGYVADEGSIHGAPCHYQSV